MPESQSAHVAGLYPAHLETVKRRFAAALEATGFDAVAIASGAPHAAFLDDVAYPFRPNPHFLTWLPLTEHPHCWVVFEPGARPRLGYHQPVDFWHKPPAEPTGFWVDYFDIHSYADAAAARQLMPGRKRVALIGERPDDFADWGFAAANPQALLDYLHYERAYKSDYELACMREANALAARGHRAAAEAFRSDAPELDMHLAYLAASRHVDEELPYPNIVAVNDNAATLHYQGRERAAPPAGQHHSFLIDAGASFHGYAADITRTYSYRDPDFQRLIERVDAMQQALCAEATAGSDYRALHLQAHHKVAEILNDEGIVTLEPEAAVEQGLSRVFFPHGLGHFIGLQVHDVGGFMADRSGRTIAQPEGHPFLRLTRTLEPGHVLTIEPGLYFIDPLLQEADRDGRGKHIDWNKVEQFRPFGGVRIEDDVHITDTGRENLTREHL